MQPFRRELSLTISIFQGRIRRQKTGTVGKVSAANALHRFDGDTQSSWPCRKEALSTHLNLCNRDSSPTIPLGVVATQSLLWPSQRPHL